MQVDANTDPLSVKEESLCEVLQELDPYTLMGPDNIPPRVSGELADLRGCSLSSRCVSHKHEVFFNPASYNVRHFLMI